MQRPFLDSEFPFNQRFSPNLAHFLLKSDIETYPKWHGADRPGRLNPKFPTSHAFVQRHVIFAHRKRSRLGGEIPYNRKCERADDPKVRDASIIRSKLLCCKLKL